MNNEFEKKFNEFREMTIPNDAGKAQVLDMKTAFYAGGLTFLNQLIQSIDKDDEQHTHEKIDQIYTELKTFLEKIARQKVE